MAAIDDLNAVLIQYIDGLADAKSALESKGVSTADLTIVNLGEKIRSIAVETTYVIRGSWGAGTGAVWQYAEGSTDTRILNIISYKQTGTVQTDLGWSYSLNGTHWSIMEGVDTKSLYITPKTANAGTASIINTITLTQTTSNQQYVITLRHMGRDDSGPIEME